MIIRFLRALLLMSAILLVIGLLLYAAVRLGWIASNRAAIQMIGLGLYVLVALPVLRILAILATSVSKRDWLTSISVIVVLATIAINAVWLLR